MPNFGYFNWIDAVIILILAGGSLVGYTQGLLRQVIGLASLYLAAIVATQYYVAVSNLINNMFFQAPSRFVSVIAFLIVFFGVTSLINLLAADAYSMTKLHLFPTVDQLGGSFIGLVTVIILLVLLLPILLFVLGEPLPYLENFRAGLVNGLDSSRLVPEIVSYRRDLLNAIAPWMPNGQIPSIFNL